MRPVTRYRLLLQQQQPRSTDLVLPRESLNYDKIVLLSVKEVRRRQKQLFKAEGIQVWKNFVLPITQVPLWVTMSMSFRNLTGWKTDLITGLSLKVLDPTLRLEGFPHYLTDLTMPDPYSLMPFVLGLLLLSNVEWNNRTIRLMNLTNRGKAVSYRPTLFDSMINLSRYSIVFLIVMATQLPAALGLYWISSNAFSLLQNILMDRYLPLNYTPYSNTNFQKALKDSKPLVKGL